MQQYMHLHRSRFNKRQHESRLTIRNLLKIGDIWGISKKQAMALLGTSSLQQLGQWSDTADGMLLTEDQVETASFLVALHSCLEKMLQSPQAIRQWLQTPLPEHSPAEGVTPLEFLLKHQSKLIAARTICQWIESQANR